MLALPPSKSVTSLGRTATSAMRFKSREIGERVSNEMQLMLMMLALPPFKSFPSLGRTATSAMRFKGREIGERVSNEMQLMLMMLALPPSKSVPSLGRTATSAMRFKGGNRRESFQRNAGTGRFTDAANSECGQHVQLGRRLRHVACQMCAIAKVDAIEAGSSESRRETKLSRQHSQHCRKPR